MAKKQKIQKSGQIATISGQYEIVGPKGGKTGLEITAVKGNPLPPTPEIGQGFVLVDKTVHKGDKKQ